MERERGQQERDEARAWHEKLALMFQALMQEREQPKLQPLKLSSIKEDEVDSS